METILSVNSQLFDNCKYKGYKNHSIFYVFNVRFFVINCKNLNLHSFVRFILIIIIIIKMMVMMMMIICNAIKEPGNRTIDRLLSRQGHINHCAAPDSHLIVSRSSSFMQCLFHTHRKIAAHLENAQFTFLMV